MAEGFNYQERLQSELVGKLNNEVINNAPRVGASSAGLQTALFDGMFEGHEFGLMERLRANGLAYAPPRLPGAKADGGGNPFIPGTVPHVLAQDKIAREMWSAQQRDEELERFRRINPEHFRSLAAAIQDVPDDVGFFDGVVGTLKNMGGLAIQALVIPGSTVTSTLKETTDLLQGEGWDFGDFFGQIADGYSFGQYMDDELEGFDQWLEQIEIGGFRPLDDIVGFMGDIALDPLTYLTLGSLPAARLGAVGLARIAAAASKGGADDAARLATRLYRHGLRGLSDAEAAKLTQWATEQGRNLSGAQISAGLHITIPGTGGVARRLARLAGKADLKPRSVRLLNPSFTQWTPRAYGSQLAGKARRWRLTRQLGGDRTTWRRMMLEGDPEQFVDAMLAMDQTNILRGAVRETFEAIEQQWFNVARTARRAGLDGKTVYDAMGGDEAARAAIAASDAPADFLKQLDEFNDGIVRQANEFMEVQSNGRITEWIRHRDDWQPTLLTEEFTEAIANTGRHIDDLGTFERKANLVAGEDFLGEPLLPPSIHPEGKTVREQAELILQNHAVTHGFDDTMRMFVDDAYEAMDATLRSLKRRMMVKGFEERLVTIGRPSMIRDAATLSVDAMDDVAKYSKMRRQWRKARVAHKAAERRSAVHERRTVGAGARSADNERSAATADRIMENLRAAEKELGERRVLRQKAAVLDSNTRQVIAEFTDETGRLDIPALYEALNTGSVRREAVAFGEDGLAEVEITEVPIRVVDSTEEVPLREVSETAEEAAPATVVGLDAAREAEPADLTIGRSRLRADANDNIDQDQFGIDLHTKRVDSEELDEFGFPVESVESESVGASLKVELTGRGTVKVIKAEISAEAAERYGRDSLVRRMIDDLENPDFNAPGPPGPALRVEDPDGLLNRAADEAVEAVEDVADDVEEFVDELVVNAEFADLVKARHLFESSLTEAAQNAEVVTKQLVDNFEVERINELNDLMADLEEQAQTLEALHGKMVDRANELRELEAEIQDEIARIYDASSRRLIEAQAAMDALNGLHDDLAALDELAAHEQELFEILQLETREIVEANREALGKLTNRRRDLAQFIEFFSLASGAEPHINMEAYGKFLNTPLTPDGRLIPKGGAAGIRVSSGADTVGAGVGQSGTGSMAYEWNAEINAVARRLGLPTMHQNVMAYVNQSTRDRMLAEAIARGEDLDQVIWTPPFPDETAANRAKEIGSVKDVPKSGTAINRETGEVVDRLVSRGKATIDPETGEQAVRQMAYPDPVTGEIVYQKEYLWDELPVWESDVRLQSARREMAKYSHEGLSVEAVEAMTDLGPLGETAFLENQLQLKQILSGQSGVKVWGIRETPLIVAEQQLLALDVIEEKYRRILSAQLSQQKAQRKNLKTVAEWRDSIQAEIMGRNGLLQNDPEAAVALLNGTSVPGVNRSGYLSVNGQNLFEVVGSGPAGPVFRAAQDGAQASDDGMSLLRIENPTMFDNIDDYNTAALEVGLDSGDVTLEDVARAVVASKKGHDGLLPVAAPLPEGHRMGKMDDWTTVRDPRVRKQPRGPDGKFGKYPDAEVMTIRTIGPNVRDPETGRQGARPSMVEIDVVRSPGGEVEILDVRHAGDPMGDRGRVVLEKAEALDQPGPWGLGNQKGRRFKPGGPKQKLTATFGGNGPKGWVDDLPRDEFGVPLKRLRNDMIFLTEPSKTTRTPKQISDLKQSEPWRFHNGVIYDYHELPAGTYFNADRELKVLVDGQPVKALAGSRLGKQGARLPSHGIVLQRAAGSINRKKFRRVRVDQNLDGRHERRIAADELAMAEAMDEVEAALNRWARETGQTPKWTREESDNRFFNMMRESTGGGGHRYRSSQGYADPIAEEEVLHLVEEMRKARDAGAGISELVEIGRLGDAGGRRPDRILFEHLDAETKAAAHETLRRRALAEGFGGAVVGGRLTDAEVFPYLPELQKWAGAPEVGDAAADLQDASVRLVAQMNELADEKRIALDAVSSELNAVQGDLRRGAARMHENQRRAEVLRREITAEPVAPPQVVQARQHEQVLRAQADEAADDASAWLQAELAWRQGRRLETIDNPTPPGRDGMTNAERVQSDARLSGASGEVQSGFDPTTMSTEALEAQVSEGVQHIPSDIRRRLKLARDVGEVRRLAVIRELDSSAAQAAADVVATHGDLLSAEDMVTQAAKALGETELTFEDVMLEGWSKFGLRQLDMESADVAELVAARRQASDDLVKLGEDPLGAVDAPSVRRQVPDWMVEGLTQMSEVTRLNEPGWFLKQFDKLTQLFKAWAVATPGFHARNFIGAVFNNALAGVTIGDYMRFNRMWAPASETMRSGGSIDDAVAAMRATKQARKQVPGLAEGVTYGDQMEQIIRAGVMTDGPAHDIARNMMGDALAQPGALGRVNPFNPSNIYVSMMRKPHVGIENHVRGALALNRMAKQGSSIEHAVGDVFKFHFDYEDLSAFERQVMRRIIPFYTWTRKNLPLQLEMFVRNPKTYARVMALDKAIEQNSEEQALAPSYFFDSFVTIRTPVTQGDLPGPVRSLFGIDKDDQSRIYISPDLPFNRVLDVLDPRLLASSANPLIRVPFERATDKKLFTNAPFSDRLRPVPRPWMTLMGPAMPMLDGLGVVRMNAQGEYMMTDRWLHTFDQTMPLLSQSRRLFSTDETDPKTADRALQNWVNFTTGAGFRINTPLAQEGERVRREFAARDQASLVRQLQGAG